MIEWDNASQAELMLIAKETNACLFSDIGGFFRPELQSTVADLKDQWDPRPTSTKALFLILIGH